MLERNAQTKSKTQNTDNHKIKGMNENSKNIETWASQPIPIEPNIVRTSATNNECKKSRNMNSCLFLPGMAQRKTTKRKHKMNAGCLIKINKP